MEGNATLRRGAGATYVRSPPLHSHWGPKAGRTKATYYSKMQSKSSYRLALNAVTYSKFDANARIGQMVRSRFRAFGAINFGGGQQQGRGSRWEFVNCGIKSWRIRRVL